MHVILPKTFVETRDIVGPLFFLMGPVKGGDDWQLQACYIVQRLLDDFTVVIPCPYDAGNPLWNCRMVGEEGRFIRQVDWERYYLGLSSRLGSVLCWLPCESKTHPRNDGNPYARDTYGEVGEWRGRLIYEPDLHFVLGGEIEFPGIGVILRNFQDTIGKEYPIYSTLPETIGAAVRMCGRCAV